MDPEKATAWLKFLRELTATIMVYTFAGVMAYVLITEDRVWLPRIAGALDAHNTAMSSANSAVVTNTEELTRIGRESCKTLKYIAKQDDRPCEIRKVVLGGTIVP